MRLLYGHCVDIIDPMSNGAFFKIENLSFAAIVGSLLLLAGCDSASHGGDATRIEYQFIVPVSSQRIGTDLEEHGTSIVLGSSGHFILGGWLDGGGLPCDETVGNPALFRGQSMLDSPIVEIYRDSREGSIEQLVTSDQRTFGLRWIRNRTGACSAERHVELVSIDENGETSLLWQGIQGWNKNTVLQSLTGGVFSLVRTGTIEDTSVESYSSDGTLLWAYRADQAEYMVDAHGDNRGRLHLLSQEPGGAIWITVLSSGGTVQSRFSVEADSFRVASKIVGSHNGSTILGYLRSQAGENTEMFATRFDQHGDASWHHRQSSKSPSAKPSTLLGLPNGQTVIGYTLTGDDDRFQRAAVQLVLLDQKGDVKSSAAFGEDGQTVLLNELVLSSDQEILAVGSIGPQHLWGAANDFDILVSRYILQ